MDFFISLVVAALVFIFFVYIIIKSPDEKNSNQNRFVNKNGYTHYPENNRPRKMVSEQELEEIRKENQRRSEYLYRNQIASSGNISDGFDYDEYLDAKYGGPIGDDYA